MPVWKALPVLKVDESRVLNVDPQNPETLLGMWSGMSDTAGGDMPRSSADKHCAVFHKCTGFIEDGRRLENLSWRVFAHETLCSTPKKRHEEMPSSPIPVSNPTQHHTNHAVPDLSNSVDSLKSVEGEDLSDIMTDATTPASEAQLNFGTPAKSERHRLREKHITGANLKNLITSIKEKQDLTRPLSPLPLSYSESTLEKDEPLLPEGSRASSAPSAPTPRPASPQPSAPRPVENAPTPRPRVVFEHLISPANASNATNASANSNDSSHSIVRGFEPGKSISTYRSQSSLALSANKAQASSSSPEAMPALAKRKGGAFKLGRSVEDEDSDPVHEDDASLPRSSLRPAGQNLPRQKKHASFADTVMDPVPNRQTFVMPSSQDSHEEDEDAILSTDDEYEDDDDDDVWEDEDEDVAPQPLTFNKVPSTTNLTSRRSYLTQGLHQHERAAAAMQDASVRSSSGALLGQGLRRSPRNGPSMPVSPDEEPETEIAEASSSSVATAGAHPIQTTTNMLAPVAPIALSPRATRRNMLAQELGVSLRKHMLHERQQRNFYTAPTPAIPRRHTTHELNKLSRYPEAESSTDATPAANGRPSDTRDYFEFGLNEYHQKGW